MLITINDIIRYQKRMEAVKANGFTAKEFKELGRELRDEFELTDRQAIAILNDNSLEILNMLRQQAETSEMITISKEEYERLLDREAKLDALECGGVDNWDGYGYAMNEFYNNENDNDEGDEE